MYHRLLVYGPAAPVAAGVATALAHAGSMKVPTAADIAPPSDHLDTGRPFVYLTPGSQRPVIMCLVEKSVRRHGTTPLAQNAVHCCNFVAGLNDVDDGAFEEPWSERVLWSTGQWILWPRRSRSGAAIPSHF